MIVRSRGYDRRALEFGSSAIPAPGVFSGGLSYSGKPVRLSDVVSLPAAAAAIRLVSETSAAFPLIVEQRQGGLRTHVEQGWQADLLAQPSPEMSQFDWLQDLFGPVESIGNAFFQKIKQGGRVVELAPIDPQMVRVRRDQATQQKVFDLYQDAKTLTKTSADILHFRGYTPTGSLSGLNPALAFRHGLGFALALEEWSGRFFQNDASPGGAIKVKGNLQVQQAQEMLDLWKAQKSGLPNSHSPAILFNESDWVTIGANMVDAQFVQASEYAILQVALMWNVPATFLSVGQRHTGPAATTEEEALRLLTFSIFPRLRRIESQFAADPDIFGQTDLRPAFLTDVLLRADAATQATVDKEAIQSGWKLPDEVRAEHGLAPLPDGMGQIPQVTPVGGAPNPQNTPATQAAEVAVEDKAKGIPTAQRDREIIVVPIPAEQRTAHDDREPLLADAVREAARTYADAVAAREPAPGPVIENHIHVPEQPPQTLENHVHVPEQAPYPAPVIENHVHVPEQPAPQVTVEAPNVTVEPAQVTVEHHAAGRKITPTRDKRTGLITDITIE